MNEHIFTPGEQKLRDTAQAQMAEASNLLNEPLAVSDVHEAVRKARSATNALEYLARQTAGMPRPGRGGE